MFSLNNLHEYEARINNIIFVCDEVCTQKEKTASEIAAYYRQSLTEISEFMLCEGIEEYFGKLSSSDIIKRLGAPIINLDRNTVTYPDNGFDDMLIIEFHFEGILENFYDLDIDG